MTDREKLPWLLCKAHSAVTEAELENDDLSYADALEIEADVLIAHGVVISKMETTTQKWISVTERLPEESGKYLAVVPSNVLSADRIVLSLWYSQCLGFYDTDAMMGDIRIRDVTHWMPLPEAPKEE